MAGRDGGCSGLMRQVLRLVGLGRLPEAREGRSSCAKAGGAPARRGRGRPCRWSAGARAMASVSSSGRSAGAPTVPWASVTPRVAGDMVEQEVAQRVGILLWQPKRLAAPGDVAQVLGGRKVRSGGTMSHRP